MCYRTTTFEQNTKGTDFFLGDLHGMYDMLFDKLAEVDFDFDKDRVFCVGDLADRGPDSVKCIELLSQPWFHCVLGNHEDFLLGYGGFSLWRDPRNGGQWSADISSEKLKELQDLVEAKCWNTLTVNTAYGTVGVVHAESARKWTDNCLLDRENNLWARSRIYHAPGPTVTGVDIVVVGHTPVKKPMKLANVLYIDTGAVFGEYLTLLSADEVFNNDFVHIKAKEVVEYPKELDDAFDTLSSVF